MDVCLHQAVQGAIDEPMSAERRLACKGLRDDRDAEVAAAVAGSCMTGMHVTLILDFQQLGLQRIQEPFPDQFDSFFVHFKTSIGHSLSG